MMNGLLPFDDVLVRLKFNFPSKCPFCQHSYSISHGFFECRVARWVWDFFSTLFDYTSGGSNLREVLLSHWNSSPSMIPIFGLLPAAACWTIWRARTTFLYEGSPPFRASMISFVLQQLQSFTHLQPPVLSGSAWLQFSSHSFLTLRRRQKIPKPIRWYMPHVGWKWNIDGSSLGWLTITGGS